MDLVTCVGSEWVLIVLVTYVGRVGGDDGFGHICREAGGKCCSGSLGLGGCGSDGIGIMVQEDGGE